MNKNHQNPTDTTNTQKIIIADIRKGKELISPQICFIERNTSVF